MFRIPPHPALICSFLLAGFLLAGCSSERARLEASIEDALGQYALQSVNVPGASIRSVSAKIVAQSGLEFTGEGYVVLSMPAAYRRIDSKFEQQQNDWEQRFEKKFMDEVPEESNSKGLFRKLLNDIRRSLAPAYVEIAPAGNRLRISYPAISGRRYGNGVRLEPINAGEIDSGKIDQRVAEWRLPQDAKVFPSDKAYGKALEDAFSAGLNFEAKAARDKHAENIKQAKEALVGSWEFSYETQEGYSLGFQISFSANGKCSGQLMESKRPESLRYPSVGPAKGQAVAVSAQELDFGGVWSMTNGTKIEAKVRPTRWVHDGRAEPLSRSSFDLLFLFDDRRNLTWYPGKPFMSGDGILFDVYAKARSVRLRKVGD